MKAGMVPAKFGELDPTKPHHVALREWRERKKHEKMSKLENLGPFVSTPLMIEFAGEKTYFHTEKDCALTIDAIEAEILQLDDDIDRLKFFKGVIRDAAKKRGWVV